MPPVATQRCGVEGNNTNMRSSKYVVTPKRASDDASEQSGRQRLLDTVAKHAEQRRSPVSGERDFVKKKSAAGLRTAGVAV
jgi:hypothetical protein